MSKFCYFEVQQHIKFLHQRLFPQKKEDVEKYPRDDIFKFIFS
jgi:hypothetical protein